MFHWSFCTDTHNTLSHEQQNRCSRCRACGQCFTGKHSNIHHDVLVPIELSILISIDTHNILLLEQPNWWPRCRPPGQCTAAKQGNVTHAILLPIERLIDHISQTLTTLYLEQNWIGAQGAEHLANALEKNTVTPPMLLWVISNYSSIIFHIDTHNILPLEQPNRCSRCRISG